MGRRLLVLLSVIALAVVGIVPSQAAVKKKPDFKGTYTVTKYPDPSNNVTNLRGDGCTGVSPMGTDKRPFTVPAAGKLTLNLISPDPTNKGVTDWDMWLIASDGTTIDGGHGGTSNEQTNTKFTKKTTFELQVCNLAGHVSFVFKYA